jgi:TRAP-type C4-dicarboxylate transport system permease small subunit
VGIAMAGYEKLIVWLDRLSRSAVVVFVITITVVMLAQVFFRYVINSSLQWSEEISIWALIWMVFIGSAVIMRDWAHINIPTFTNLIPIKVRPYFLIFSKVATILFLLAVIWFGFKVFNQNFHARSPSLGLSTRWAKLAIPVGAVLMAVFAFNAMLLDLINLRRGNDAHFENQGNPGLE